MGAPGSTFTRASILVTPVWEHQCGSPIMGSICGDLLQLIFQVGITRKVWLQAERIATPSREHEKPSRADGDGACPSASSPTGPVWSGGHLGSQDAWTSERIRARPPASGWDKSGAQEEMEPSLTRPKKLRPRREHHNKLGPIRERKLRFQPHRQHAKPG